MFQSVDLVNDRVHFLLIVLDGAYNTDGCIEPIHIGDFRCIEIVHTLPGRAVYEIISGMLVRPGCSASGRFHHLKDSVGLNRIVGEHRDTAAMLIQATR